MLSCMTGNVRSCITTGVTSCGNTRYYVLRGYTIWFLPEQEVTLAHKYIPCIYNFKETQIAGFRNLLKPHRFILIACPWCSMDTHNKNKPYLSHGKTVRSFVYTKDIPNMLYVLVVVIALIPITQNSKQHA